ncbi:MAG: phosphate signaling complex protein PhoU [Endomicrobiia bacterium]
MLEEKISKLKNQIIEYSNLIIDMFSDSLRSIFSTNKENLQEIIKEKEVKANEYEIELEEKCIYVIAQYEPKAFDLRFILSVLKMTNDLERMGDHIVNISQSGVFLMEHNKALISEYKIDIEKIFNLTHNMFTESITSFIEENPIAAKKLCELDQQVDDLKKQIYRKIIEDIKTNPKDIEDYIHLERIINNIERIADLTTNICEDIIFLYEARIIKHHRDEKL